MKKFISRVQNLSQRAAELKAALETAPATVSRHSATLAGAAGQFRQLRADVQETVHGLRTEGEDRLVESLREIDESVPVFRDAGYVVQDVEMELGIVQRLIVHLEKADDLPVEALRQLATAHSSRRTTTAILTALAKAEEFADRVDLVRLGYHKLTVYVGLAPSVRICWCLGEEELAVESPAVQLPAPTPTPSPAPAPSAFTQTSYFERRPLTAPAPVPASSGSPSLVATTATSTPVEPEAPLPEPKPSPAAPVDPLARFKRMPDLSKGRRAT
jgi:hypothetical protein